MSSSFDQDESAEAGSAGAEETGQRPDPDWRAIVGELAERRKRLGSQDALGRTPLFYAAEKGDEEQVKEIIFRFRGTGMYPPRLALITTKDHAGLTAADVAEQNGHEEIARLLRSEQGRMEYYE